MPAPHTPAWIVLALALGVGPVLAPASDADEAAVRPQPARPAGLKAPGGSPAEASEAAAPPEALAIPFAHHVGERWRLAFELQERRDEGGADSVTLQAEAQVLSPLGRDLLVELRWTSETRAGATLALWPRREESAALLDARGGGRLLLRVDVRGTALHVTNAEEARAALERALGAAIAPADWPQAEALLLQEWNVAYGACGVPLVPHAPKTVALTQEDGQAAGNDERVLLVEEHGADRPRAWSVRSRTQVAATAPGEPSVRLTSDTRYDLASRRLSGWQLSVRTEAQRQVVRRIAFEELSG